MKPRALFLIVVTTAGLVFAEEPAEIAPAAAGAIVPEEVQSFTGEGFSFFKGVLVPSIHVVSAVGDSTAEDPGELAVGHHDPNSHATLQSLDPGLSLRAGTLQGFANYSITRSKTGRSKAIGKSIF